MHVGPCTRTRDYSTVPVEHKPDRDAQAATSTRLRASNVARIEATWPITVLNELTSFSAISALVRPKATAGAMTTSRAVSE
jgi:hypothetical protein